MSVTEYERHQIFQWFEENMGTDKSSNLMKLLPPVGWGDIATKTDLDHLGIQLRGEIARLDGRIDKLDGRIDKVEGRLMNEMAKLRHHLYAVVIGGNVAVASVVLAATRLG